MCLLVTDSCCCMAGANTILWNNDLQLKINTKGTFHVKMGSIKGRNGMDLTEAEDIKKKWQEYTEELYQNRSS